MFYLIPLSPDDSIYDLEVELSGFMFKLDFQWNVRSEFWSITLYDAEDNLITTGVPQTDFQLFINCTDERMPKGKFFVIDNTNSNKDITRDNFGTDILLFYED